MADPNTLDPAEGSGLAGLLRAITAAETCDFADARPLAAQACHSEALLRWEIEHLFRKEWIRAGREDDGPSGQFDSGFADPHPIQAYPS